MHNPNIHFEASPSDQMNHEMGQFVDWFNETMPNGNRNIPPLTRAGIAHLYFVCIHPFEDRNGRIARGIFGKNLSQYLGEPMLLALSQTIQSAKKAYYTPITQFPSFRIIWSWPRQKVHRLGRSSSSI